MRRACCASTLFESIFSGFWMPCSTARLVISLNITRCRFLFVFLRISARCQQIASPSRSGSGARKTLSADSAAAFKSSMTFLRPGRSSYAVFRLKKKIVVGLFVPLHRLAAPVLLIDGEHVGIVLDVV